MLEPEGEERGVREALTLQERNLPTGPLCRRNRTGSSLKYGTTCCSLKTLNIVKDVSLRQKTIRRSADAHDRHTETRNARPAAPEGVEAPAVEDDGMGNLPTAVWKSSGRTRLAGGTACSWRYRLPSPTASVTSTHSPRHALGLMPGESDSYHGGTPVESDVSSRAVLLHPQQVHEPPQLLEPPDLTGQVPRPGLRSTRLERPASARLLRVRPSRLPLRLAALALHDVDEGRGDLNSPQARASMIAFEPAFGSLASSSRIASDLLPRCRSQTARRTWP